MLLGPLLIDCAARPSAGPHEHVARADRKCSGAGGALHGRTRGAAVDPTEAAHLEGADALPGPNDPADVEHVLSTNVNNWVKSDHFLASAGEVFGKSFLGINHAHTKDGGAMWRLQRKVATRVFTTNNFKTFTEGIFHKYAMTLADLIKKQDGKCDMHEIASQYTLQTTFDIVCGVPLQSFDEGLGLKFIKSMDSVFVTRK